MSSPQSTSVVEWIQDYTIDVDCFCNFASKLQTSYITNDYSANVAVIFQIFLHSVFFVLAL